MCRRRWSGNGGSARPMTSATLAAGAAIWRTAADPAEDAEVLLAPRATHDDGPLVAAGIAAARRRASVMGCFVPVARVLSSPALRCTDTVRPYADGFGERVETEPCLAPYGRSADFSSRTGLADSLRQLLSCLV